RFCKFAIGTLGFFNRKSKIANCKSPMRVFIVANTGKPMVRLALQELLPWLKERVEIVGVSEGCGGDWSNLSAEMILVLGGDGTILNVARKLGDRQIPIIGPNFGRLGGLAEFTPDQFRSRPAEILRRGRVVSRRPTLPEAE